MPGWWTRVSALVAIAAAVATPVRADDDVPAAGRRPPEQRPAAGPGIDLAMHVDLNVTLRDNEWRLAGGVQHIVIGGRGPLVFEGNLTIGGGPVQGLAERVRLTDELVLARLRQAQRDHLAAVTADPLLPADRRRALELATEVDIRRVMAEIVSLRDRYAGRRANLGDADWQAFQQDVRSCRQSLADPFGSESLVAAVRAGFAADDAGP
jgi:hypothetical protein